MPINIGNPQEITINKFAQEICDLANVPRQITYHPLPVNDPLQRRPDISLAKEILGWQPKISREEGLKRTFEYFKTLSIEELNKEEHKDFSKYIY